MAENEILIVTIKYAGYMPTAGLNCLGARTRGFTGLVDDPCLRLSGEWRCECGEGPRHLA
jgi:hypothetical protein